MLQTGENMKLPTYNQLRKEFDKKVKELQAKCPHNRTHWAEEWWAIGHSTGNRVKVCKRCNKIMKKVKITE